MADTNEDRVKRIVGDHFDRKPADLKREDDFINDLGADSLDSVEVVMHLEEEFDVEISDDDAEHINTVGDAIDLIERLAA